MGRPPKMVEATLALLVGASAVGCGDDHATAPDDPDAETTHQADAGLELTDLEDAGADAARVAPPAGALARLDTGRAVSAELGRAGGELSTSSADGVSLTLEVPPGALAEDVEITLTPVRTLDGLELSGGLLGAAHFAPEGLSFLRHATLRIRVATPPDPARVHGFAFGGDGAPLWLQSVQVSGADIEIPVFHFSGAGAALGGDDEAASIVAGAMTPAEVALGQLAGLGPEDADAIAQVLADWYASGVGAGLSAAVADSTLLQSALAAYSTWRDNVALTGAEDALAMQVAEAEMLLVSGFVHAIEEANQACISTMDPGPITTVVSLQTQAELLGLVADGGSLDLATILETLCLQIEILDVAAPSIVPLGQSVTLDVTAVAVLAGMHRYDLPVNVQLIHSLEEATSNPTDGPTDDGGHFSSVVSLGADTTELSFPITAYYPPFSAINAIGSVLVAGSTRVSLRGKPQSAPDSAYADTISVDGSENIVLQAQVRVGNGVGAGKAVTWQISGPGSLVPVDEYTDGDGVARAYVVPASGTVMPASVRASVSAEEGLASGMASLLYAGSLCADEIGVAELDADAGNELSSPGGPLTDTTGDTSLGASATAQYGALSARAHYAGSAGMRAGAGAGFTDYIVVTPSDPAALGTRALLRVRLEYEGSYSGASDAQPWVDFSVGMASTNVGERRMGANETFGPGSFEVEIPMALGSPEVIRGGATITIGHDLLANDTDSFSGDVSLRWGGIVSLIDGSGQPVPYDDVCSASGTSYTVASP